MNITPNMKAVIAAGSGIALGFIGGFAIGHYRAKKEFMEHLDEEIREILEQNDLDNEKALLRKADFPTAQSIRPQAAEGATPVFDRLVTEYGGHTLDELRKEAEADPNSQPVDLEKLREHLANASIEPRNPQVPEEDDETVTELSREGRTLDKPYVISIDEYHDDDEGQEHVTITWYTGGDMPILVDERQMIIDNVDYTVGELNMTRFGEGSSDPNIVYIRNHQNGIDYEVVRSKMSYNEGVFGVPEVSQDVPMRSMRQDDDI